MRLPRTAIASMMILCCCAAWSQQMVPVRQPESIPAATVLTLEECIKLAFDNQPSIRQAAAQVEIQTGQVGQARSRLLPGTSVTSSDTLAGSNNRSGSDISVGASQLVYDFGRSPSQLTQAQRQYAASVENLTGTEADVIFIVKQAYYNLLRTNHLVDVFTENVKAQDEHVAEAQARLDAGVAPLSDVLKARAAAASARVDLVTARNNAAQSRVDLNTAMGVDVTSPTVVAEAEEPAVPLLDESAAVKLALGRRPEIRRDELQTSAAESSIKVAKTGNLPAIATSADSTQNMGGQFGSSNSWTWLVSLRWTPFDSGSTAGAVRQAKGQFISAQETLYGTRQTVAQEVVQTRLNVIAADEQLTAAIAEVASARESLDAAIGRYQANVGILLDVLDAQAALLKAEVDEFSARYGLSIGRAGLEHAVGGAVNQGGRS